MDRRKFMQSSAITGATASLIGRWSHAQDAPDKYRVGIIGRTGKGNYGHGLDVVWKGLPRFEVVAVADDDANGLRSAIGRTGAQRGYADYREMLQKESLQFVAVCPRWTDQHHAMAMACAAAECHVYLEKPFCRTLVEADEIVDEFKRRGLKLAVAHNNRYRPDLAMAREMVADGEIGDLLEIRARGKEDRRGGGEDLWVLGTHVLDLMHSFLGPVDSCFARVTVNGRPIRRQDVRPGNEGLGPLAGDGVEAVYAFANGTTGHFASHRDRGGRPSRFAIVICGSRGVLEIPSDGPIHVLKSTSWSQARSEAKWEPVTADATRQGRNDAAVLDLVEAIEEDRLPLSNMYDARVATEMIMAVFESQRRRRPVSFPLETREHPLTLLQ